MSWGPSPGRNASTSTLPSAVIKRETEEIIVLSSDSDAKKPLQNLRSPLPNGRTHRQPLLEPVIAVLTPGPEDDDDSSEAEIRGPVKRRRLPGRWTAGNYTPSPGASPAPRQTAPKEPRPKPKPTQRTSHVKNESADRFLSSNTSRSRALGNQFDDMQLRMSPNTPADDLGLDEIFKSKSTGVKREHPADYNVPGSSKHVSCTQRDYSPPDVKPMLGDQFSSQRFKGGEPGDLILQWGKQPVKDSLDSDGLFQGKCTVKDAVKALNLDAVDDVIHGMTVSLYPHQHIALKWVLDQENDPKRRGGILGDDMGLGKTVTMIGAMVMNRCEDPDSDDEDDDEDSSDDETDSERSDESEANDEDRDFIVPDDDEVEERSDTDEDYEGIRDSKRKVNAQEKQRQQKKGKGKEVKTKKKPKDDDHKGRRTTLIVAPGALLQQWKDEIESKTARYSFNVYIHHGVHKLKSLKELRKYDVVLTTYHTLNAQFPQGSKTRFEPKKKKKDDFISDDSEELVRISRGKGVLGRAKWRRVILDEAHYIRNRKSVASDTVCWLDATYRWVLTGTPIINTIADLYPLFRFLQDTYLTNWENFRNAMWKGGDSDRSSAVARMVLVDWLLRRTKDTILEGRPILELGPRTIAMDSLEFSPEERRVYDAIEKHQQRVIKTMSAAGVLKKNIQHVFVMLLRLRQACCHPQLLAHMAHELLGDYDSDNSSHDDFDPINENTAALAKVKKRKGANFVQKMKDRFRAREHAHLLCDDETADDILEACLKCAEVLVGDDARVGDCGHEFCGDRAKSLLDELCPGCSEMVEFTWPTSIFKPSAQEIRKLRASIPLKNPDLTAKDQNEANDYVPLLDKAFFKSIDKGDDFEPSVKMKRLVELLKERKRDSPSDKVVVYSQWTSHLDLIGVLLHRERIKYLRYDGLMTREERDEILVDFKQDGGPFVMLMSLRCGSVGLNLIRANRVINLDLSWNSAIEKQAFDRVYRMGQDKPVFVNRLVVKGTIEERMLQMQEKKQALSDVAIGDGSMTPVELHLTAEDIQRLVGLDPEEFLQRSRGQYFFSSKKFKP